MTATPETPELNPVSDAALNLARSAAEGSISVADVEWHAVEQCKELFGTVAGPGDPLWPTHVAITKQAIALGALTASELGEWTAVIRQREGRSH